MFLDGHGFPVRLRPLDADLDSRNVNQQPDPSLTGFLNRQRPIPTKNKNQLFSDISDELKVLLQVTAFGPKSAVLQGFQLAPPLTGRIVIDRKNIGYGYDVKNDPTSTAPLYFVNHRDYQIALLIGYPLNPGENERMYLLPNTGLFVDS